MTTGQPTTPTDNRKDKRDRREYRRRQRQERLSAGLCVACGVLPHDPGFQMCGKCRERRKAACKKSHVVCRVRAGKPPCGLQVGPPASGDMAAYKRRWRAARREAGLCTSCPNRADLPNRIRCSACQQKDRDEYRRLFTTDPVRFLDAVHRRRAKKKGNGGRLTAAEWRLIKALQEYACLRCGKQEPEIKLCIDHVIPVDEGGPNVAANIQGLCKPCNSSKGTNRTDYRPNGPWL